ncbi:hypothetical protein SDC9_59602 [bioreactor metagenome]|uniref:Uncharacterized protein n=1 Tax=bioreactor metagenome TaxID=1076179 RepID=A0A644XAI9_9ZZZZ
MKKSEGKTFVHFVHWKKEENAKNPFRITWGVSEKENGQAEGSEKNAGSPADPQQGCRRDHGPQTVRDSAEDEPPCGRAGEHPGHERPGGQYGPEAREDGREAQDGHGVCEGEEKGGKIVCRPRGSPGRLSFRGGSGAVEESPKAEIEQEEPPSGPERPVPFQEKGRQGGQPESRCQTVKTVCGRRAQTREKAGAESSIEGAPDAQDADGAYGSRDGKTQYRSPEEQQDLARNSHGRSGRGDSGRSLGVDRTTDVLVAVTPGHPFSLSEISSSR